MARENHHVVDGDKVQCDLWAEHGEATCISPNGECKNCWLWKAIDQLGRDAREEAWQKTEDDRVTREEGLGPLFELLDEISPGTKRLLEWGCVSQESVHLACVRVRYDIRKGNGHGYG